MTAVPAIDAKVRIRCENDCVRRDFAHPHQASVGKAHRDIRVFLYQLQYRFQLIAQVERGNDGVAAEKSGERCPSAGTEKMEGLRQNCLAGHPRPGKMR
jgi:hypothetical protein